MEDQLKKFKVLFGLSKQMSTLAPLLDNLQSCSVMYFENCPDVLHEFIELLKVNKDVDYASTIPSVDANTMLVSLNFHLFDRSCEEDQKKQIPREEWKYICFVIDVEADDHFDTNLSLKILMNSAIHEKMIIIINHTKTLAECTSQNVKDRVAIRVFKNADQHTETETYTPIPFVPIPQSELPPSVPAQTCISESEC